MKNHTFIYSNKKMNFYTLIVFLNYILPLKIVASLGQWPNMHLQQRILVLRNICREVAGGRILSFKIAFLNN